MFDKRFQFYFGSAMLVGVLALSGCSKAPQANVEQPPAAEAQLPAPGLTPQASPPNLPKPKPDDVLAAVKRIFKDSVVLDDTHKPNFFVGDFNGDESQDLAAIVRPSPGRISDLNQEFPNWLAREPLATALSKTKPLASRVVKMPDPASGQTVHFQPNDVLLAIIHGFGPQGWRDPQATQTHLMRDVVGANMHVISQKEAASSYANRKRVPPILGDLIQETLIGQSGFLHFSGAVYNWYDPTNYQPAALPAHAATSRMR
jgi:hypothetical protein